jgi:hypothetical protein
MRSQRSQLNRRNIILNNRTSCREIVSCTSCWSRQNESVSNTSCEKVIIDIDLKLYTIRRWATVYYNFIYHVVVNNCYLLEIFKLSTLVNLSDWVPFWEVYFESCPYVQAWILLNVTFFSIEQSI